METTYNVIQEGQKSGYLKKLIEKGLISYAPIAHLEIYEAYLVEKDRCEKEGYNTSQAVHNTAVKMSCSEASVWRVKKKMED